VVLGIAELVAGGLTADSGVEFYLMAWAGTTGGIWFLFEKAEQTLSDETRRTVAARLREADARVAIESIPSQFALLFDRVFGERHLSWRCFKRSSVASLVAAAVSALVISPVWTRMMFGDVPLETDVLSWVAAGAAVAVLINLVVDYLSLLETRLVLRYIESSGWLLLGLVADFVVTALIGWVVWGAVFRFVWEPVSDTANIVSVSVLSSVFIGFLSTFMTSVWLWLFAGSVPLSRLLLGMNSGVGFLLRVTDIERQPFRSMGFVSVILVSGLFALGLPLVLL